MKLRVPGLLTLAVLIASCGDNGPAGPGDEGDWIPLEVGSRWVYELEGLWITPTDADTTMMEGTAEITVMGVTTHAQGFTVYRLRDVSQTTVTTPDTTITSTDSSFYFLQDSIIGYYMYDDSITIDWELVFRQPPVVGDSWTPDPGNPQVTRTVESLNGTVTVPAGTFTGCAQLEDHDALAPQVYHVYYYKKGVGLVYGGVQYADSALQSYWAERLATFTP